MSGFSQQSWNMTYHDHWTASHSGAFYNDCWGYVDTAGREYAIFGSNRSTHFLDVSNPDSIVHIATFDGVNTNTDWRDFKVVGHYAFGVNDGGTGSLQIFDLQYLPDSVVKIFDHDSLGSTTHSLQTWGNNLYMVDNSGFGPGGPYSYPVRVVDVSDPHSPTTIGGIFDGSYNKGHDLYVFEDTIYLSVYFSGQKDGLHAFDMNDPANPKLLGSLTSYPEAGINHSSWGTPDRQTLVMADETHGSGLKTVDISDPSNMNSLAVFRSFPGAMPHNPFIVDSLVFVAYYHDGLQVWNIKDPSNPVHVGYYDTDTTIGGGSNYAGYEGCWGTYPFFPSGTIIASDISNGLFTITLDGWPPPPPPPPVGISDGIEHQSIVVYPNPSNGRTTVKLGTGVNEIVELALYNTNGSKVYSKRINARFGIYDFDFSDQAEGIYFMTVKGKTVDQRTRLVLE